MGRIKELVILFMFLSKGRGKGRCGNLSSWLGNIKVLERGEIFFRMLMLHQNLFSWWKERGVTMLSDFF